MPRAAFATLVLVAVMLAANVVAARIAIDSGLDVPGAVAARSLFTALMAAAIVSPLRIPKRMSAQHRHAMFAICLLVGLQSLCLYAALACMPVALAVLIFNTHPLWSALVDGLLYRRPPGRAALLAMPFILFGVALSLDVPALAAGPEPLASWRSMGAGTALALLAAAAFGTMLVLSQRDAGDLDGRWRTTITMTVVGTLALAATFAGGGPHWPQAAAGWLAFAVLCLMYGVAFILLVTLLPRWGVVGNSPVLNIEPVAVLLLAWWLLDQRLSNLQLIGVAVVISGVLALALRARPRKPEDCAAFTAASTDRRRCRARRAR
jgi:drug/metabolite transporter (DMT)-like permease